MKQTVLADDRATHRPMLLALGVLFALGMIAGIVQFGAAAEIQNDRPAQETPEGKISPDLGVITETNAALAAQEPSVDRYVNAHSISQEQLLAADLTASAQTVSPDTTPAGGLIIFKILVDNSGETDSAVTVTDVLPSQLVYEDHACVALVTITCDEQNGTITWEGTAVAGHQVEITIKATVDREVESGLVIDNTAVIASDAGTLERQVEFGVRSLAASPIQFLPYTAFGLRPEPMPVTLSAGVPNGRNTWDITWTESPGATHYELQESKDPTFDGASTYVVGGTKQHIEQFASPFNVFHYRVRSMVGGEPGPWSNAASVVGAYRDDFDDANTGWAMRRTTYLEEVHGFYETSESWYVMQVLDPWDWGIASPGMPAPRLPYVIEYEVAPANLANLLSFGFAFAADWPSTGGCPSDPDSFSGLYEHDDCFNHFYNPNTIFFGGLKVLWERVDQLRWCLNDPVCQGGSPMKRLGDVNNNAAKSLFGVDPTGWNKYRLEVREDGIKFFAGKRGGPLYEQYTYSDTRWVGDPYFGVFASTDEYSNSTWRFDYVHVVPIDD